MNKYHSLLILWAAIAAIALYTAIKSPANTTPTACIRGICLKLEIADTQEKRETGLMNRASLPKDWGMIFVFHSPGTYSFWMKNTLIPLDIIWIGQNHTIVHIEHADPCKKDPCPNYLPKKEATYVIEANQGFTKNFGITEGDKVKLTLPPILAD